MNMIRGRVSETEVTFDEYSHHALTQELAKLQPGDYWFGILTQPWSCADQRR